MKEKAECDSDKWEVANERALGMLKMGLGPDHQAMVTSNTTFKKLWTNLKEEYDKSNKISNITLEKVFHDIRLEEGESMSCFIRRLENARLELKTRAEIVKTDAELIGKTLTCLEKSGQHESLVNAVLLTAETTGWGGLKQALVEKDKLSTQPKANNGAAFNVNQRQRKCSNCRRPNHVLEDCFAPGGPKYKKKSKQKFKKNYAAKKSDNDDDAAIAFNVSPAETDNEHWYLDSGASQHMTGMRGAFQSIKPAEIQCVKTANHQRLDVHGKGTVTLKLKSGKKITMQNVL